MIESYTVEVVVVKYIHCEEAHGFTRTVQRYEANDLEVVGVFKTLAKAQGLLKNIYSLANATEIWSHGSRLHPRFLDWRDGIEGAKGTWVNRIVELESKIDKITRVLQGGE